MSKYQHSGRTDQTKAALKRHIDAQRLQAQRRWRGAMYVAGYSVECKLKARLMEKYDLDTLEELEDEIVRRLGRPVNVFTHSIEVLFGLTGARDRLLQSPMHPNALRAYQKCNKWKPAWRYKPDDGTEDECVVSRTFDNMREKSKQDLLWGAIDKSDLTDAEKVKISMILPYSPDDLK